MPYIQKEFREYWKGAMFEFLRCLRNNQRSVNSGVLTYILTTICHAVIGQGRFQDYAKIIAALECTKLEFYRAKIAPYEETKKIKNGDL